MVEPGRGDNVMKIIEDEEGRVYIIVNPTQPASHIIAVQIDEFDRHLILWSGAEATEWLFVES